MARIEFDQIAHSYYPNPKTASDYALKEINTLWEDGGAYALLGLPAAARPPCST
jgi:glycerol transport system ATP-binding protein